MHNKSGIVTKANTKISSAVRNVSCTRGWLRWLIQAIFGVITVVSFILILGISMSLHRPRIRPRCEVQVCRVICDEAPYFGNYEQEIIKAVLTAEANCQRLFLQLNKPMFKDERLPEQWLNRIRSNVIYELAIIGGNLAHITRDAFLTHYAGQVRILVLEDIKISSWDSSTFVGLQCLTEIFIRNCEIVEIDQQALRPVESTIQTITIMRSSYWNPLNVTGLLKQRQSSINSQLTTIDFSFNYFLNVITNQTFAAATACKILYLNNNHITSIGPGSFDHFFQIELIYLNNNELVTLPTDLFFKLLLLGNPPMINLHFNQWYCGCEVNNLRQLKQNNLLPVDPLCYYPDNKRGKTFSEIEIHCGVFEIDITSTTTAGYNDSHEHEVNKDVTVVDLSYRPFDMQPFAYPLKFSPKYTRCVINNISNKKLANETKGRKVSQDTWIKPSYFIKTIDYSIAQIGAAQQEGYGLIWFQTSRPDEIYCINNLPNIMRIYNLDLDSCYTFCPVHLRTGDVNVSDCLNYNLSQFDMIEEKIALIRNKQYWFYLGISMSFLIIGALFVYGLVRRNPSLLKGSKRLLFVKHKNVEALVLPPKVPLRNNLLEDSPPEVSKRVFIMPSTVNLTPYNLKRSKSIKSNKSIAPSYISALQPTEDQLAEWRLRHHFDNNMTITSIESNTSRLSWIYETLSNDTTKNPVDTPYESLN